MNELIPFTELQKMATVLGQTKMFGKTPAELLPLMLIAQAEGKHPAIAAQEYDIIQGRPAINSRAALSRFQIAGGKIEWKERTDKIATAVFSHPQGGALSVTWTMERAALAGLTAKDNWKKYPAQMLSARVVAEGVRAVFPGCLSGLYTVEEVQDFDPPRTERNVTPDATEPPADPVLYDDYVNAISAAADMEELKKVFIEAWTKVGDDAAGRDAISRAKDARKKELANGTAQS